MKFMNKQTAHQQKKTANKAGFRIFLLTTPFLLAYFVFCYLPLRGWIYAFYDYKAGFKLSDCSFVGLKHFTSMFSNPIVRRETIRVLRNTLGIGLINICTSFLPMLFAIFLNELTFKRYRKVVQTITTIPNFISWVLVYSMAYAMFSMNDGFVNKTLRYLNLVDDGINYLASSSNVWLKMWLYGTWKGLGWSAVIYIASINSIDQEMYEAAEVDGAGRFKKIIHITIPSLLPTFFVLLMLTIANFLNNGMEQYYCFQNAFNKEYIEVLDLFVYNQGLVGNNTSLSTAVGILKSLVSIVLLFTANTFSQKLRGQKIF